MKYWKKGWISLVLIAGAFGYLLNLTWLRWGSLLIDTGRDLCVPWKLLSGHMLYRDIFYEYGPLTPYLNAFLCMIFGVHMRSFIFAGILTTAILCMLIYKISRIFLSVLFATFAVMSFLFVLAFSQHYEAGIFNSIIPYAYSAIYSMALAISALFFYYRAVAVEEKKYHYLCSFFIALTLITKAEIGITVIVSIIIGIILGYKKDHNFKDGCKQMAVYCLFPVLAAGLIYGLFAVITNGTADQNNMIDMTALLINLDIKGPLTGYMLGTADLAKNIMIMLLTALYYLGMSIVFFIAGWVLSLVRGVSLIKKGLIAVSVTLFVLTVAFLFQRRFFPYPVQYRCVPIICIAVFVFAHRRYSAKINQKKFLFLSVFCVFSFLLLTRMMFNVWASHYGFYLLIPGMLCYYFFFLKIVPEIFGKKEMRNFYRFAFTAVSIIFIVGHVGASFYMFKNRTMEIVSPRGSIRVRPGYYRCKQLLEYLREKTDPSESLVIFPQGSTLNFLSERENPMRLYSFLPLSFLDPDFEETIIKGLEDNGVRYVVILRRDTSDYGPARFGIDYAQGVLDYLARYYVIEKQFGPWPFTSNEFSLVLLKRT